MFSFAPIRTINLGGKHLRAQCRGSRSSACEKRGRVLDHDSPGHWRWKGKEKEAGFDSSNHDGEVEPVVEAMHEMEEDIGGDPGDAIEKV
ncbi:hypothetical protein G5I_10567 [Acromyrmex echinatior]|uniref:Uncharacterized protein n=1 Tax=Acromyrmex echinatior TaxID=103372 RepID=F4WX88_ACREC|nr:hypothetical protein G5I_10567 [Acromyrmex echinatior]